MSTTDKIGTFRFFFSIFALLMLPLASPFLSAKLRQRWGRRRVIVSLTVLLVVIPTALALVAPALLESIRAAAATGR